MYTNLHFNPIPNTVFLSMEFYHNNIIVSSIKQFNLIIQIIICIFEELLSLHLYTFKHNTYIIKQKQCLFIVQTVTNVFAFNIICKQEL